MVAPYGSSPRGRGTQRLAQRQRFGTRFIPAWAGNAPGRPSGRSGRSVHPRVGGERKTIRNYSKSNNGSSPRGRGTHGFLRIVLGRRRFIPAWAGNAENELVRPTDSSVHPRVGGERNKTALRTYEGSGSSPRGRGTLNRGHDSCAGRRFIPAWAGNADDATERLCPDPVHPRVGGERVNGKRTAGVEGGSSPRGRGTPLGGPDRTLQPRFIPAWAGNAGCRSVFTGISAVHPRVGGERGRIQCVSNSQIGSSPRGRGTPFHLYQRQTVRRFIPAWAGNAKPDTNRTTTASVHPRVGGERIVGSPA